MIENSNLQTVSFFWIIPLPSIISGWFEAEQLEPLEILLSVP